MASERLNVIALISGGKDSFYSALQCIHQGHRFVALANLFPGDAVDASDSKVQCISPDGPTSKSQAAPASGWPDRDGNPKDLNSFMYQTVGHEIIPLYAAATGLPLYRQPIVGGAQTLARDYDYSLAAASSISSTSTDSRPDEAESMLTLLQAVKAQHPEANAVCAGAILSTYQRTRVESIALRLGLTPLAYLWKYPILPPPSMPSSASAAASTTRHTPMSVPGAPSRDEAQLLRDMGAAGLEARIVKVASAGLDESHLWECVTSDVGVARTGRALRKFGTGEGTVLGEGGEFETVVLDGPAHLFRQRVVLPDAGRKVVQEGGGTTWLMLQGAYLESKGEVSEQPEQVSLRTPDLLDPKFASLLDQVQTEPGGSSSSTRNEPSQTPKKTLSLADDGDADMLHLTVMAEPGSHDGTIDSEISGVVDQIRKVLASSNANASQITTATILLRDMGDFPRLNAEYGKLFTKPNPPSRVTISCGDQLPAACNIVVHLTLPANPIASNRNGLHVQSRSFWAPANIGPYSQAIDVPISPKQASSGIKAIFIAGQIPLIPATMLLPSPSSEASRQMQIVLSLQHLWRIGVEMKVQLWTSAVAYFARAAGTEDMRLQAASAARAWELIHVQPAENEEDQDGDGDDGIDPWDLKYNSQYASLSSEQPTSKPLPDWEVYSLSQQNSGTSCTPPFFAVEVESLPRGSDVEWHGHIGLSQVDEGSIQTYHFPLPSMQGWAAQYLVARTSGATWAHSVLYCSLSAGAASGNWQSLEDALRRARAESLKLLNVETSVRQGADSPYLVYADTVGLKSSWTEDKVEPSFALIPCRSIWSLEQDKVGCVALFKTTLFG